MRNNKKVISEVTLFLGFTFSVVLIVHYNFDEPLMTLIGFLVLLGVVFHYEWYKKRFPSQSQSRGKEDGK